MTEALINALVDAARADGAGERLAAVAEAALTGGIGRAFVLDACQVARGRLDDVAEDRVLDLMDRLVGWCAPGAAL